MCTVLLVDSDPLARRLAKLTLEAEGFRVLAESEPEHAGEVFDSNRDEIAMLIVDVSLAGPAGTTVARQLLEKKPGLVVLLMSGYFSHSEVEHCAPGLPFRFVAKPFLPSTLAREVARATAA